MSACFRGVRGNGVGVSRGVRWDPSARKSAEWHERQLLEYSFGRVAGNSALLGSIRRPSVVNGFEDLLILSDKIVWAITVSWQRWHGGSMSLSDFAKCYIKAIEHPNWGLGWRTPQVPGRREIGVSLAEYFNPDGTNESVRRELQTLSDWYEL